jgi:hypothetical protein
MQRNDPDDRLEPVLPDAALPDTALPDTAMASGTDAGEPGEHLGPADLMPDEQRLLSELERGVGGAPDDAAEDTDAAVEAAEDEAPLPAPGGPQDDGLNPEFSNPEQV